MRLLAALPCFALACTAPEPLPARDTADADGGGGLEGLDLTELPTRIVVDTLSGAVQVFVSTDGKAEIRPILATNDESWGYTDEGGILELWSVCANGIAGCGTGFVLTIPATQPLTLTTVSGAVDLDEEYAGEAEVTTSSGAIVGDGLAAAELVVDSASGAVTLDFVEIPTGVTATTVSGAILLTVPMGMYTVDAQSGGVVTVEQIQQGEGPPLTLTSTSGVITITGQ